MIPVKNILIKIALQEYYNDGIEMIYADGLKYHCYLKLASLIVNYKEQVLIIEIKANIQYSVYHVLPQEWENLTKIWLLRIHKST